MTEIPQQEIFILDIDGTLMHTHEIDNDCYWGAVHEVFGVRSDPENIHQFTHVSDSGILREWCNRQLDRDPSEEEIAEIQSLFLGLMESVSTEKPELFAPRPGLVPWLETMSQSDDIHLAVATGSWGVTARFKLDFAGLSRFGMALASADDGITRTDIMSVALSRLQLKSQPAKHHITYIGDGPWDFHASQALGWGFIGIAEGGRADALLALGAQRVNADFLQLQRRYRMNGG